ncbi:MAG: hypothetical protein JNL74_07415, partial [Fibrobacteres bacterium]|nr:hypothetical protein [Fibrobacterota bacterium]
NLLTEPGRYIFATLPITYEGVEKSTLLASRLLNIMAISLLLISHKDLIGLLSAAAGIPFLSSPCRIGLRAMQNLPAITMIFKEEYRLIKGVPLARKHAAIIAYMNASIERLLKSF